MSQTRDKTNFDWVGTDKKSDRDGLSRRLSSQRTWCAAPYNNDRYLMASQISSQRR